MKSILSIFLGIVCFSVSAQNINVSGTVIDTYGEPLVGVTVQLQGKAIGTVTDIDGNFILSNIAPDAVLEVSYVGMRTQVVNVNGRHTLSVTLEEDSEVLSEVVVTGFGLAQRKESLTSAIAVIGAEDISRSKASTSSGALVGKIAGINSRQTDGRPGSTTNIQIRNMGRPLFVIDGIQSDEGQFNNIDFNDIESISVLKDASASIYGVRAANGVVVVNTKKGSRNTKNTVTLNAYYGMQSLYDFPRPADAVTYIKNYIQSETVQGRTDYRYTKEDYQKWQQGTEKGYVPFDWYDYIWETSPQTYINANVSGGSDKINYYLSVGNLNQDAIIVNYGGFNRTNVQMNVNANITDRLKIGGGMNGRIERRVNPGVPGGDDYWLPRFGTFRNLPTRRPFANDNPLYPTMTSTEAGTNFAWLNYDLSGKYEEAWRVVQLTFDAEYEIMDGLKARALASYYLANQKLDNQEYTYKLYDYDEKTDTYPVMFENTNPWRERRQGYNEEVTSNIQLSYNKRFADHNIAAVLGLEAIKRDEPSTWVHSIPTSNALHLIDYETMDTYDDRGNNTQARLGYMGRINYDFANKYLVELSGRYDGSWKFPPNHRWGFFPSGSFGWRISEENFWRDSKVSGIFSDLKLRASYGLVGDDNVSGYNPFDYMSGYNYKQYRNNNGDWVGTASSVIDGVYTIGTQPRGLPVTTLSWIKARILDVGLDASFLGGKLSGSFDFFRRMRTGLPASRYDILLPSEVGFSLPSENLNSDMHMGYDFATNWSDKINELTYSIGANVTYSRFYDWEQYKPRFSNSWNVYRNSINHRFGYLNWGLEADGQFQSWEEIASWPIDNDRQGNRTLRPGDIKYKDVNGDGVINGMDERPIGYRQDSTPVLNFGLNFSFLWRGFDLAFDLTGGGMSTWYQEWEQRNPFHDGGNNPQYYMEDTWRLTDIWDANSELIPGKYPMLLIGNSSHSNYWNSTFWKKNVRYIKVRNLEFGYTVPKSIVNKASISDLRLYLAGQNLFGLTNLINVDPEIQDTNGLAYPTMRIINVGLTLKF
ncbi:SusC/RagA family TonB-linked outer membrane protein [Proteiniphilum sp. X52]|uniref:SusC/RagA family TonB-linked outer membrane protein n=1 Tax=Proteiniphilum TaxID=294702 RepID=UPI0003663FFA